MKPEEFFRLALDAGATVEYADGILRAEVKPRVEIAVATPTEVTTPRNIPRERVKADKAYPLVKEACSPWTTSHIAHIAAALAVMHGARTGEWSTQGVDTIVGMIKATPPVVDMPTLIACVQRATRFKQANKVDGQRMTMSTGSLAAAMYDAMAVDSTYKKVEDLEPLLASARMIDTAKNLANGADTYGGARSIEFRKQSYAQFLQVFTRLK